MATTLEGKKILAVDDEPDIGKLIQTLLKKATVHVAHSYAEARAKLQVGDYDVVILDIMGVDGHALLREFSGKFPCIMLTAHALTPQDLRKSVEGKAVLYLPKDELSQIEGYVLKVLETPRQKSLWGWLIKKVDFNRHLGSDWMKVCEDVFRDIKEEDLIDELERRR